MDTFWGSGSVEGGEQRPSCSTFWSDNATGLAGGLAQCHGRAGREYCREEKAFCEHNIRCFRPILTVRGGQEDKRPTKCGGYFVREKREGGERIEALLIAAVSYICQVAPASLPLFAQHAWAGEEKGGRAFVCFLSPLFVSLFHIVFFF